MNYLLKIAPAWMRDLKDDKGEPILVLQDGWCWSDSEEAARRDPRMPGGADIMSSHDDPHYHPSPNVTETRTATMNVEIKSAPDAEGFWWARDRTHGDWTIVHVDGRHAWRSFDAWIGPLEPPTVTP